MVYVAVGALVIVAVQAVAFTSILRYVVRQGSRERELLVNQLCHLAGRPWREPPREPLTPEEIVAEWAIPEQMEA